MRVQHRVDLIAMISCKVGQTMSLMKAWEKTMEIETKRWSYDCVFDRAWSRKEATLAPATTPPTSTLVTCPFRYALI